MDLLACSRASEGQRSALGVSLSVLLHLMFQNRFSQRTWNLLFWLDWLASKLPGSARSTTPSPTSGSRVTDIFCHITASYIEAGV